MREKFRDLVTIEIVAFPQSGIARSPGTDKLLDEAMGAGADLVGGLDPVGIDNDLKGHLDTVFGIAAKHGKAEFFAPLISIGGMRRPAAPSMTS